MADLPDRAILDEVQRVPQLFTALKSAVDRRRTPGRFLLTGSANVLLMPRLADSLAGRMEIVRLHPLAQAALARKQPGFLEALFRGRFNTGTWPRLGAHPADRRRWLPCGPRAGGLASTRGLVPRLHRDPRAARRQGPGTHSRPGRRASLPRPGGQSDGPTVQPRLPGRTFQQSQPTIRDYVTLLERVFLLETLPPWHSDRLSRLIKTPKLHLCDTGLACSLLGPDAAALSADRSTLGHLLETFVFHELRRQASWDEATVRFFHFRDKNGADVDIVLERGARELARIEVKAAASVTAADFRGLSKLRQAAGNRFAAGFVLYDGETRVSFGDDLHAVPIRCLWETT